MQVDPVASQPSDHSVKALPKSLILSDKLRAREVAQRSRVLIALADDWGSILSTHNLRWLA